MVRFAILGAGRIGNVHARSIAGSGRDGLMAQKLAEAASESLKSGQVVKVR